MASHAQNRRSNNFKSGANRSEGSSNASSPTSSINLSNTNVPNNNNAPKYGTLVPNRVFVGGISSTTTEEELCQLFKKYGNVKATKIIVDRAGVSKGYGFVTFESEEEAKLLQRDADNIVLKERRLNIAPAIKKQDFYSQPFNKSFETPNSPPPIAASNIFYHNGIPYTFHNGMAFFTPTNSPAVPALPAPPADPNAVFQGYGPQPTPPATFGPTIMYANPGPMFMPPQYHPYQQLPFECFQQMPNGGPYIYNGSGTSSTGRSSPVNTPDIPALPVPPPPPPPTYFPPSYQQAEFCYQAVHQGMYPVYSVNTQEGYLQYCEMPQPVDPPSSNISSEDSSSTTSVTTSDHTASGEAPFQNNMPMTDKSEISNQNNGHLTNTETPIVSLLSLQQNGEERERNVRPVRRQGPPSVDLQTTQESYTMQASVGMMLYQSPGMYHTPTLQQGVMYNGHMMSRSQMIGPPRNQTRSGSFMRGGRGGYRGRNRSTDQINNVPFVPKFPSNFNNNNPAISNNNYYSPKRIQNNSPSRNHISSSGRGGRYLNSQAASPSPPPAPYSPMTRSFMFCGSNPSLTSSPPPQVPQHFIQNRQYYSANHHQYSVPPPLPPKRYQNSSKRSNGPNNMAGNGTNNRGKYKGHISGTTVTEKSALVGAGDAPSMLHHQLTSPAVSSSPSPQPAKELSSQIKTLTI